MKLDRREFLKKVGLSSLIGLGGLAAAPALTQNILQAAPMETEIKSLTAKRWGMAIDVMRFQSEEDYQRCITACHEYHNVPEFQEGDKKEVKWIWKEKFEHAFPGDHNEFIPERVEKTPVLLLCNHCANPPCVRVCPTQATFKRKSDGIVVMDMHRCIGCRFCMAACPYGARSFNWFDPRKKLDTAKINPLYPTRSKGVVEKCNFCSELLARGEKPKCVEASNGAIAFGDLDDPNSEVVRLLRTVYAIRRKSELGTEPSVFYIIR